MGWGRTLFLGDIGNRLDIEDTERDIGSLKREHTTTLVGSIGKALVGVTRNNAMNWFTLCDCSSIQPDLGEHPFVARTR